MRSECGSEEGQMIEEAVNMLEALRWSVAVLWM